MVVYCHSFQHAIFLNDALCVSQSVGEIKECMMDHICDQGSKTTLFM